MQSTQIRRDRNKHLSVFWEKYGPWAVVTGASDGIGREISMRLAESGLNLVLVARRRPILEDLATKLTQEYQIEARVIDVDLSQQASVEHVLAETLPLDVGLFVACAGFGTSGQLVDTPLSDELDMLNVNCRAAMVMSRAYGQRFVERGRGGIVLMSSLLAFQGVPQAAHYAATKAYIQTLAEGLHAELAPRGVDVIASAPGPTQSGFATRANLNMSLALSPQRVGQATLDALGHRMTVRPGWLSKFLEGSLSFLPRWGRVYALGRVMKGMTEQKPVSENTQPHSVF